MMNYMWKKMRELKSKDSGFTLIELLIVILILGILAGIAIFSYQGFAARAEAACAEANARMDLIAQAANEIDPSIAVYHADGEPDCSGAGGGGGPTGGTGITATFLGAANDASPSNPSQVAVTGAAPGTLLVAVTGHRQNVATGDPGTVSMGAGWTQRGSIVHFMDVSTNDRRAIAVFTRIADGSATDNATATWTGAGINTTTLHVQRFTVSAPPTVFNFAGTVGGGSTVSSLALTGASGGTGNSLMVVGLVGRDDGTATSGLAFSGAGNLTVTTGASYLATASAQVSGAGPHSSTASWTDAMHASGFVLIVR